MKSRAWWTFPGELDPNQSYRRLVDGARRRDQNTSQLLAARPDSSSAGHSEYFGALARLSVHTEDIGGQAAEALLSLGLPPKLRAGLVRAMWDEIRHAELFAELADRLAAPPRDLAPIGGLIDTLQVPETELEFALVHTELEAVALDTFRLIAESLPDSQIGLTYQAVSVDEASHVRLGNDIVGLLAGRGAPMDLDRALAAVGATAALSFQASPTTLELLATILGRQAPELHQQLEARRTARYRQTRQSLLRYSGLPEEEG